jgi:hypothetical protein
MARMDWEKARRRDRARRLESDYSTDPVIGSDVPRYASPAVPRPCLSRWSDAPRRRIPVPAEPVNPHRLVLHWFNPDGSVGFTATGDDA